MSFFGKNQKTFSAIISVKADDERNAEAKAKALEKIGNVFSAAELERIATKVQNPANRQLIKNYL